MDLDSVEWVEKCLALGEKYGTHPVSAPLVPARIIANESGYGLYELLVKGQIDAVIDAEVLPALGKLDHIRRLSANFKEKAKENCRGRDSFPIMLVTVTRLELYKKYLFVTRNLYHVLKQSKRIALESMFFLRALRYALQWLPADLEEIR